jgi:anaerobic magnesium-protoporphyrin IX monomethyl ester cyclase
MKTKKSVVVVAPNSFIRFTGSSFENQFQILTKSHHLASLANLDILFNSKAKPHQLERGWKSVNPMAGYYLESFLKMKGYEAKAVFDWDDDNSMIEAMKLDPIAICLSTTYITDNKLLADCIAGLRNISGSIPILVGGPYVWKQKIEMNRYKNLTPQQLLALKEYNVNMMSDCTFNSPDPSLRDAIYIAHEFGEYTLLKVLHRIEKGQWRYEDLTDTPNLVLPLKDGSWHATEEEPEPVDLNRDFTRWDLVELMPSLVPVRASVGCPYRCRYCDFIELHPKVIMRKPESMLEEIRMAKKRGKGAINFIDDNIFLTKKRIAELTKTIREKEMDIIWGGFFRVDRIDETNIDDIYESGGRFGLCGIESGDDGQLKRMRKGCDRNEIHRGIELATHAGMTMLLTFIVGYPGETRESIDNTADFINNLSLTNKGYASYQVYPFYLLPNTSADDIEYRKEFDLKGRYSNWQHNTMNSEEAVSFWSPYLFRKAMLPYQYDAGDYSSLRWSVEKRRLVIEIRRQLTIAFLDGESEEVLQSHFAQLYRLIKNDAGVSGVPSWKEYLAERTFQPGERRSKNSKW